MTTDGGTSGNTDGGATDDGGTGGNTDGGTTTDGGTSGNADGGMTTDGGVEGGGDGGMTADGGTDGGIILSCGDKTLETGEACDDGNATAGDGCAADCKALEPGWFCDTVGAPCIRNVCGDGRVSADETCDDHNVNSQDGCSATCAQEPGWYCPPGGGHCTAAQCGDDIIAGAEECDDGNASSLDGCSATCRLESGYKCPVPGQPCAPTVCGDAIVEGTEQCDDGNHDMGDGCSPLCAREPLCSNGTCTPVCGDGVLLPGDTTEECDDGNQRANDGCSPTCTFEPGFQCQNIEDDPPASLIIPVVYRDFVGVGTQNGGTNLEHPDFNNANGTELGIVASQLGVDGKPVYAKTSGGSATTHGKVSFDQWYRDTVNVNQTVVSTLQVNRQPDGTYLFNSQAFFPLDGKGWVASGQELPQSSGHNYSFTSELRYWFEYKGTEVLAFTGDDDVWVFINRRLAVDLGGVHTAQSGSVTLSQRPELGLIPGKVYEAAIFQAERHVTLSSYRLTLTNFGTRHSECVSTCGDGIVQPPEQCDNGPNGNTGGYGQCAPGCVLGPRCGDGVVQVQAGEECDDGNTQDNDACSNACQQVFD